MWHQVFSPDVIGWPPLCRSVLVNHVTNIRDIEKMIVSTFYVLVLCLELFWLTPVLPLPNYSQDGWLVHIEGVWLFHLCILSPVLERKKK